MPLFRIAGKLHYFAHVPKCGGSSVERYLLERFGQTGFQSTKFDPLQPERSWTRTSPQHVDWESLTELIPEDWIESVFMVVRHPISRVISDYHYQRDVRKSLSDGVSIDEWFANFVNGGAEVAQYLDNHLAPQVVFAPVWATVFCIESGLDHVVAHLDRLSGRRGGPRSMPYINQFRGGPQAERAMPSARTLATIREYYAEDFDRFGYNMRSLAPTGTTTVVTRPPGPTPTARALRKMKTRIRRIRKLVQ